MKMPAASSSTSAANSSLDTSAQPAFKRFKFLRNFLSRLHAGDSTNRGSTCASVQGQIQEYVSELLYAPQDEDALSFWQKCQAL